MARKVTVEDIEKMNIEYLNCHSYAEVARRTGWAASTVKNYIYPDFGVVPESEIKRFDPDKDMPQFTTDIFKGLINYGDLCVLSEEEKDEIRDLWKEITV